MPTTVRFAASPEDREAIFRLRYAIYVEEMGYKYDVDHLAKRLPDAPGRASRLLLAEDGDTVVGTLKFDWGGDGAFTAEEHEVYRLDTFLRILPRDALLVFSRFMTDAGHRSGSAPAQMIEAMIRFAVEHGAKLVFCDCRPHLLNTYMRLGFRTYARTTNDPVAGLLVPLVLVLDDRAHLQQVGSRLLPLVAGRAPDVPALAAVQARLPRTAPVHTLANPQADGEWSEIRTALADAATDQISIFHGFGESDIATFLAKSHVITCTAGDRIVSRDAVDRTVFIVLDGAVEVIRDDALAAVLTKGAVFGEVAFLLGAARTADVLAASDGVRVIVLREKALAELIASESAIAARLLLNLARILCLKLAGDAMHH